MISNYKFILKHYKFNVYFSVYHTDGFGIIAEVPFCKYKNNEYEMKDVYVYDKHMFYKDDILKQLFEMELIEKSSNNSLKLILTSKALVQML